MCNFLEDMVGDDQLSSGESPEINSTEKSKSRETSYNNNDDDDKIEGCNYLKSIFPKIEDSRILYVLNEYSNINSCVDHFLNETAICELDNEKSMNLVTQSKKPTKFRDKLKKEREKNIIEFFSNCMKLDSLYASRSILSKYGDNLWESIFHVINEKEKVDSYLNKSVFEQKNTELLIKEEIYKRDVRYYSFDLELYLKIMNYFKNDVKSVIYLVEILLLENEIQEDKVKEMTFLNDGISNLKKKETRADNIKVELGFQTVTYNKNKKGNSHGDKPKKAQRNTENKNLQNFDFINEAITLDLHGLTKDKALEFSEKVIDDWWNTEIENRIILGTISTTAKRINCVQPLRIITGQGIHSNRGISVLKTRIRRYLDERNFVYQEDPGSFTLNGKRR